MSSILQSTKTVNFRHLGPCHRVPDVAVFASLIQDVASVAGVDWYACGLLSGGQGFMRGARDYGTLPAEHHRELLRTLCVRLNSEMPNGGHWVTVWNNQLEEMVALYRDSDGDLQFTCDLAERTEPMSVANIDTYLQRCAEAFDQWFLLTRKDADMRPVEGETFKRALGEQAPSVLRRH